MWLAVDAAGGAVRAWPVGGDGNAGEARDASDLAEAVMAFGEKPGCAVIDGAAISLTVACPSGTPELSAAVKESQELGVPCHFLPMLSAPDQTPVAVARALGALAQLQAERPTAARHLVCIVDARATWVHAEGGRFARLSCRPIAAALQQALGRPEAAQAGATDEDDDVGFERGLSLTEASGDPGDAISQALARAAAGDWRGGALGAALAGALIGADAAKGLRLGRLGGPLGLVGDGLLAQRYAVALGRFGVAVRRLQPRAAFIRGCQTLAAARGLIPAKP